MSSEQQQELDVPDQHDRVGEVRLVGLGSAEERPAAMSSRLAELLLGSDMLAVAEDFFAVPENAIFLRCPALFAALEREFDRVLAEPAAVCRFVLWRARMNALVSAAASADPTKNN